MNQIRFCCKQVSILLDFLICHEVSIAMFLSLELLYSGSVFLLVMKRRSWILIWFCIWKTHNYTLHNLHNIFQMLVATTSINNMQHSKVVISPILLWWCCHWCQYVGTLTNHIPDFFMCIIELYIPTYLLSMQIFTGTYICMASSKYNLNLFVVEEFPIDRWLETCWCRTCIKLTLSIPAQLDFPDQSGLIFPCPHFVSLICQRKTWEWYEVEPSTEAFGNTCQQNYMNWKCFGCAGRFIFIIGWCTS